MHLILITPNGKELNFVIEDWESINEHGELTEIGLACVEYKHTKVLQHILEYHSIVTRMSLSEYVIVNKPNEFSYTPKTDTLRLDFSTNS